VDRQLSSDRVLLCSVVIFADQRYTQHQ
jgi:hypothetical protein